MKKIRITAPDVAPMVRRMAMSLPLSFTSMIRPEMMLSAATSTISVRIMNITLRSTCRAEKKVWLRWRQSVMKICRPAAFSIFGRNSSIIVGIVDEQLDRLHDAFGVEIELRLAPAACR